MIMLLLYAAVLLTCASLRGALAEEEPHPIQTLVMMVPMAERKDNMDFIYSALLTLDQRPLAGSHCGRDLPASVAGVGWRCPSALICVELLA